MIMTSEADARGRTGFENNPYPQGDYLRAAFVAASTVTNREVIEAGFSGAKIGEEIRLRRLRALEYWKARQEHGRDATTED
jgi:tRNA nucleotidyltransferase (CCA-adding enzyme)